MFVASDIFVVIDSFGRVDMRESGREVGQVQRRWQRKAVGWTLYFWGQVLSPGVMMVAV
jgi:hypothetical protein